MKKRKPATSTRKGNPIVSEPQKATSKPIGKSVDEFRALYDKSYIVPKKVRAALGKLGDGWLREAEFAKMAEVNPIDLAAFRDEFEEHIVALAGVERGKRAWAGTKKLAARLKEMLR